MQKKCWICMALLLVIPGLLFTASCAKKTVKTESSMTEMTSQEKQTHQAEIEKNKKEWADYQAQKAAEEKQRAMEEERLRAQRMRDERLAEERRQAEIDARIETAKKTTFLKELILFDFDSAVLSSTAQYRLTRKAEYLNQNSGVKIIIEGHCDNRGTNEYNLALGERRAEAAKAFLVDLGVSASRLTTISYGEERPFAKGAYEGAWAKNRRAHFVIE